MNDEHAIVNEAAERYAEALFELATEANAAEAVEADLASLKSMLRESADLRRAVNSPLVDAEDKASAMTALADKAGFQGLTRKFLGMVAENRRAGALMDMIYAFEALSAKERGATRAKVTSAEALSDKELDAVRASLKTALGRDVEIDAKVDPALIAGLKIKVGSRLFDSSLRTRLERLRATMKEA